MNMELYISIMCEVLSITRNEVKSAKYKITSNWTSFNHLVLVTEIEEKMNCCFTRSEIMRFKSFYDGKEILKGKGLL